jgi:hypothetical protein
MNPTLNRLMIGSRKIAPTTKRFLGHAQRGIRVLGSVTNALNQVGITNPHLTKVNDFAQRVAPAITPITKAIESY